MADNAVPTQSPSTCQFCDESVEIKLFCVNCELFLCLLCSRKIHSKIKTCQDHKIIQLKDLGSEEVADTRRRVDFENLTCEDHKGQKCVEFCMECRMTICLKCSYETHQNHTRSDLEEFYGNKLAEVKGMKGLCFSYIVSLDFQQTKLTKINADKNDEYKIIIDGITKREADLIAEVKKHSQKLQNKVHQVYQPIFTIFKNNLSEVEQVKSHVTEIKVTMDNILNSHQAMEVLQARNRIHEVSLKYWLSGLPTTRCVFTPGFALDSKVGELFGVVHKIPELKLIKIYQTNLIGFISIVSLNKNEKLFSSLGKLQKVRFDNDRINVLDLKENVGDMALMKNGDVILSCDDGELKILTMGKTNDIKLFKTFHPLVTLGVTVDKNNQVLVGMKEPGYFIFPFSQCRRIVLLNQSGDILHTYEYTDDEERLFTRPETIITCMDTICVVDLLSTTFEESVGRVVALDYSGKNQWIYEGEGNLNQIDFCPIDMAVTPTDLILVADDQNHAIHVLNPRGQVIVCHQVWELGVDFPFSLCVDSAGLLWVTCSDIEGPIFKKVYVLKGIQ